jgi:hypothetical protein
VIVLGSVKGSPGVTTFAAALAVVWPGPRPVLVEADCAGGDLGGWHLVPDDRGTASLAAGCRTGTVRLAEHTRLLRFGAEVVVAAAARRPATVAVGVLAGADPAVWAGQRPAVVDVGRLEPEAPSGRLVARAGVLLLVCYGDEASLLRVADLDPPAADVRLVLVGGCSYPAREVTELTGRPVAVQVPWDPYAARVIAGRAPLRRGWTRRGLPAAARAVATALSRRVEVAGGAR